MEQEQDKNPPYHFGREGYGFTSFAVALDNGSIRNCPPHFGSPESRMPHALRLGMVLDGVPLRLFESAVSQFSRWTLSFSYEEKSRND